MSRAPGRPRGRAGINRNQNRDPPAPENWQELFHQMEARMLRAEAELQQLRQQVQKQVPEAGVQQVGVPAMMPQVVENTREPLYERFRKQGPPTFEGGLDALEAEEWMSLIASILDFMKVEGNDRVACASHMLRKDARIWSDVVGQRREVAAMTWLDFQTVFNDKYYSGAVRAAK